ncbi:MAG: nucleoside deaminase [Coriobacteriia bacterium]|nr:nucleoside deaminase [Coriobacteriia bacterium]
MTSKNQARYEFYMREALREAQIAYDLGEVPIGAVCVYDDQIISHAHNVRELLKDPAGHAEFIALEAASLKQDRWRLSGLEVFVTLEPCVMCAGLMVNARIERCVFGAKDPKGGALETLYKLGEDKRLNHGFEVVSGVLEDECSELLRRFFKELRHKNKRPR